VASEWRAARRTVADGPASEEGPSAPLRGAATAILIPMHMSSGDSQSRSSLATPGRPSSPSGQTTADRLPASKPLSVGPQEQGKMKISSLSEPCGYYPLPITNWPTVGIYKLICKVLGFAAYVIDRQLGRMTSTNESIYRVALIPGEVRRRAGATCHQTSSTDRSMYSTISGWLNEAQIVARKYATRIAVTWGEGKVTKRLPRQGYL